MYTLGLISSYAELDRVFPPFQATIIGSSVSFVCRFGEPYSLWYHNGNSNLMDIGLSISLTSVTEKDSGKYECVVEDADKQIIRGRGYLIVKG